jgi:bifunctional non-homologous end joining protein LigD
VSPPSPRRKGSSERTAAYRRKRDPAKTPEPFGDGGSRSGGPIFVVQRHDARRLHYDLRLERDGALASWAVPKGLPLEPGDRRLAVHVEDHPLEYARFQGEIPKGEYGAGTVEIWDDGTYELLEEKRDGGLTVRLAGRRLRGVWTLVPAALDGDPKNWLLLRKRDESTPPKPRAADAAQRSEPYRPMLATLARELPRGPGWIYEVKWDGYRALCRLRGGEARLWSRTGQDLTERFASIARALPRALRTPDCVVDGEVCALDERGRPSFALMQRGEGPLVLELFDLLELEGERLIGKPLVERRERLEALVDERVGAVRFSASFDDGAALFAAVKEQGLEGVMAKRADSPYQPGKRTRDWLKVKAHEEQEFVIAGYTRGQGRRSSSFGALVLAVRRGDELVWAGNCGTGFTEKEIERLLALLRPLEQKESPLATVPKMPRVRAADVVWVRPELVCEVEFVEWTRDGRLRAPAYKGLREDKPPEEVQRERPEELEVKRGSRKLRLTNLGKVFWPEERITKGDLLEYYERVGPVLVPHLRDRPFTMKRFPDGIEGGHFFQKDAPTHMPKWIPTRPFPASSRDGKRTRTIRYPLVNDELALLWMVNMGCIDMNAWLSRVDRPDRPDAVLFDLDPSDGVPFRDVVRVALLIRELLGALGLEGYPKTSGADGMHVLVPIARRSSYEDTRAFADLVAGTLARAHPKLVTTEWARAKRHGVLIDANQNRAGATIASAYSVRPHPGAPVSTPLRWDELTDDLVPGDFTMDESVPSTSATSAAPARSARLVCSGRSGPKARRCGRCAAASRSTRATSAASCVPSSGRDWSCRRRAPATGGCGARD